MRIVLLVLLVVPSSHAVNCYLGAGSGAAGIYTTENCGYVTDFCYKQEVAFVVTKGCGAGLCTQPGCYDGICCCYGDFCNSASGKSLMAVVATAVAAVLWKLH